MWKANEKNQRKSLLSNVGKIQMSSVKSDDLMLWKHGNTHNKINGVSATKEVSKEQKDLAKTISSVSR